MSEDTYDINKWSWNAFPENFATQVYLHKRGDYPGDRNTILFVSADAILTSEQKALLHSLCAYASEKKLKVDDWMHWEKDGVEVAVNYLGRHLYEILITHTPSSDQKIETAPAEQQ